MGLLLKTARWTTALGVEQSRTALQAKVKPGQLLALEGDDPRVPFRGEVTAAGFRIVRRSISRNSFAPVVTGSFTADGERTVIAVSLEPHFVMASLALVWSLATLALAAVSLMGDEAPALAQSAPLLALPVVGPALLVGGFRVSLADTLAELEAALPSC
jgi:hypothetical protein